MVLSTSLASLWLVPFLLGYIVEAACSAGTTSTLTDTTQISSLAASCPTYTGDLNLNVTGKINMTGIENVVGSIKYRNDFNEDDVTIHSSTLENVTGSLLMYGAWDRVQRTPGRLNISLPALRTIHSIGAYREWGMVSINTDPKLNMSDDFIISSGSNKIETIDFYANVSTVANIWINSLDFRSGSTLTSSAQWIKRQILLVGNSGLKRVLLDSLDDVRYAVDIKSNPDLDYISSSLTEAGLLRVQKNGRDAHLSVPNLKKLGGRSDPGYHTAGGDAGGIFQDLGDVRLPQLAEVHGDDVSWFEGKLNFTSNFFSELRLPRLVTANCTLGINENVALNDVSIPRLNYVKHLEIHDNTRLLNFTANLLKKAESINMTGPFTNVEFFNLGEVMGDFYLVGDKSMDCSWFDEHFLNGIVKGPYKCVGNHTKPATERKPSTATNEAELQDGESEQGGSPFNRGDGGSSSERKGGLSTGAKAGIGAGVGVAGLILLGCGAGLLIRNNTNGPSRAVDHDYYSGFQKSELDRATKSFSVVKQAKAIDASEKQDTGKSELLGTSAKAELSG